MTEVLIIGAGLTGLFASALAVQRGAAVTLAAQGRGGLEISHGCIDVWGKTSSPSRSLSRLHNDHPYSRAGLDALRSALQFLGEITHEANYPLSGKISRNLQLPTANGAIIQTALAPLAVAQGNLIDKTPFALAALKPMRDFYPRLVAANLRLFGVDVQAVIDLPLPGAPEKRDAYALDLAYLFDNAEWREEIARAWKPRLTGVKRLGLPAVIGIRHHQEAYRDLQESLGVTLFEIPTLPPSLPGIRLERILRRRLQEKGVLLIEGTRAVGQVDGRSAGTRVSGAVLQTAGGPRLYSADVVLLATGGVLHGGLKYRQDGHVQETVFDLPVHYETGRADWTSHSPMQTQPFSHFGLHVNDRMQPLGTDGSALFENLFVAGGLIAGADRAIEGSRQGIDLATAFRAVEVALA